MVEANAKLLHTKGMISRIINAEVHKQAFKDRTLARIFKITSIVLGSSLTIILGVFSEPIGTKIGLILSGLLTIISSSEAIFNYQAKSLHLLTFSNNLEILEQEINFYMTGRAIDEMEMEKANEFHQKYLQVWSEFYTSRNEANRQSFTSYSSNSAASEQNNQ